MHLHALKPGPDIQFEPLVKFESVALGQEVKQVVLFKNEGRMPGTVRLEEAQKKDRVRLTLEPAVFDLEPEEIKKIEVRLKAEEADSIMKLI